MRNDEHAAHQRRHTRLWLWVGLRMSALAACTVVAIAFGMWLYFNIQDAMILRELPPDVQEEVALLREHPRENQARLWALIERHYAIEQFLPGLANPDWWMLAALVTAALPLILLCGLLASRPLSHQFTHVARAAHRVSDGDFSARADVVAGAPHEIAGLAADFNLMATRLQQYERELRESSAMLAHELRTPLNAAMGRVQGMLDEVFPRDEEQLRLVHRQLEQINRLVGDLHLVSLARAGRLALERDAFDLDDLVVERLEWAGPSLRDAGMTASRWVPPHTRISADRDRIGQVLSALIDNAVRYAAAGGQLEIVTEFTPEALELHVRDRGPGVDATDLPQMVDRFWRAEHSRARHSGGSGLGLAVAAAICEAHGGALMLANRQHGGLSAKVRLPRLP